MFVNTNVAALNAQLDLSNTQTDMTSTLQQLSSGLRINSAADDPAGLAISQQMQTEINGMNQAYQNSQTGVSFLQTADGALSQIQNLLQSMYSLATESANGTNVGVDRASLQSQMNQYTQEIDSITNQTSFNTKNLLDGVLGTVNLAVGANPSQEISFNLAAVDAVSLGVAGKAPISAALTGAGTDLGITGASILDGSSTTNPFGSYGLTANSYQVAMTSASQATANGLSLEANANYATVTVGSATASLNGSSSVLSGTGSSTTIGVQQNAITYTGQGAQTVTLTSKGTGLGYTVQVGSGTAYTAYADSNGNLRIGNTGITINTNDLTNAATSGNAVTFTVNAGQDLVAGQSTNPGTAGAILTDGIAYTGTTNQQLYLQVTSSAAALTTAGPTQTLAGGATAGTTGSMTSTAASFTGTQAEAVKLEVINTYNGSGTATTSYQASVNGGAYASVTADSNGYLNLGGGLVVNTAGITAGTAGNASSTTGSVTNTYTLNATPSAVTQVAYSTTDGGPYTTVTANASGQYVLGSTGVSLNAAAIGANTASSGTPVDTYDLALTPAQATYQLQDASTGNAIGGSTTLYGDSSTPQTVVLGDPNSGQALQATFNAGDVFSTAASSWNLASGALTTLPGIGTLNLTFATNTTASGSGGSVTQNATVQSGLSIMNYGAASTAQNSIQSALNQIASQRAQVGSLMNRLSQAGQDLQTSQLNLTSAQGTIMDANMAQEMSNLSKDQVLEQSGIAMLAQAQQIPQMLLKLLS